MEQSQSKAAKAEMVTESGPLLAARSARAA